MFSRPNFLDISLYVSLSLFFFILYVIFFTTTPVISIPSIKEIKLHKKIIENIQVDITKIEKQVNKLLFDKTFKEQFNIKEKRKVIVAIPSFLESAFVFPIPFKKVAYKKYTANEQKKKPHYELFQSDMLLTVPYIRNKFLLGELTFFFDIRLWIKEILKKENLKKKIFISAAGNIFLLEDGINLNSDLINKLEKRIKANYGDVGQYHLKGKGKNIKFTFLPEVNFHLVSIFSSSRFGLTFVGGTLLIFFIVQVLVLLGMGLYKERLLNLKSTRSEIEEAREEDERLFDFIPPKLKVKPSSEEEPLLEKIPRSAYESKNKKVDEIDNLLADLEKDSSHSLLSLGEKLKDFLIDAQDDLLEESLEPLLKAFPEILNKKCALLIKRESSQSFEVFDFVGFSKKTVSQLIISSSDNLLNRYLTKGQQVLIKDNVRQAQWLKNKISDADLQQIKSIVFIPLIKNGRFLSVLCLADILSRY